MATLQDFQSKKATNFSTEMGAGNISTSVPPPKVQASTPAASAGNRWANPSSNAPQFDKTTLSSPTTTGSAGTAITNERKSGTSWENSNQQNMDPTSLAALQNLIKVLSTGGTPEIKAEDAKRKQMQQLVEGLLGSVSTEAAKSDASSLMALNLQQAMEKNMPAISKAIEGAGTSASSMQGLLSQQLARDASLAAGALGADQAKAYAGERSNLANTLEALTRPTSQGTTALLNALQTAKGAVTNVQRTGGSSDSGTRTTTENKIVEEAAKTSADTYTPSGVASAGAVTPTDVAGGGYFSNNTSSYWNPKKVSLAEWMQNPTY